LPTATGNCWERSRAPALGGQLVGWKLKLKLKEIHDPTVIVQAGRQARGSQRPRLGFVHRRPRDVPLPSPRVGSMPHGTRNAGPAERPFRARLGQYVGEDG